jgi:hypothetical protein
MGQRARRDLVEQQLARTRRLLALHILQRQLRPGGRKHGRYGAPGSFQVSDALWSHLFRDLVDGVSYLTVGDFFALVEVGGEHTGAPYVWCSVHKVTHSNHS